MNYKKKILVISHEASLSGAPILLLSLLNKLQQEREEYKIDIFLIRGGDLYEDFAKISTQKIIVANYYDQSFPFLKRNFKKVQSKIKDALFLKKETKEEEIEKITSRLLQRNYDLVYANSAGTFAWTIPFFKKNIPTIVAIHEMVFGLESSYSRVFLKQNISEVSTIIAGSSAVAENLINRYQANEKNVRVIHSFVDSILSLQKTKATVRKELGIKEDELVIGIVSSQELRKGTEFAPILAKKISDKTNLNFKFLNVGGKSDMPCVRISKLDAEKLNIEDKMVYIEHNKIPNDYINAVDIFVLPSREDPFPLVMLTAAKLKKPIVAFLKSGGAEEFLEDNHGILVPYLDLDIMATEIVTLLENESLRIELGNKIYERVEKDYSAKDLGNKIITIIDELIKK